MMRPPGIKVEDIHVWIHKTRTHIHKFIYVFLNINNLHIMMLVVLEIKNIMFNWTLLRIIYITYLTSLRYRFDSI